MLIKKISAKAVRDSRREKTIQVIVRTTKGSFKTSPEESRLCRARSFGN